MDIHIPYFDETPQEPLSIVQKDAFMKKNASVIKKYPKNTQIILDASSEYSLYLYSGLVKLSIFNEVGVERLLYYLKEKNSCVCGYPNVSMLLETIEDSEIYYVNTKQMLQGIVFDEHLINQLWESTHRRLGLMAERVLDIGGSSNKGKICKLLYNLAQASTLTDEHDRIIVRQLPSRTDMALYVGTHKANVVKCLTQLEKNGIITRQGKGIIINNMEQLKTIIQEEYYQQ
ncbi:MAG: Crp/Fnr family transcriptional regulator [Peptococcaceae bacterium]|nr:Crp/Fnr family transcriptional regulator [Peptococcaceae bacterium]MBO5115352.1 Crp/Fnr family transcriptional regulator [Peptococcaceae bacterium]MBO5301970.1 Crp/Fnr family transcriptional regulator [Peptococcaceae bacterium]MBO5366833.1 Crp/Fnr family transcriptional regulator [Peptococcaceae bacterium]MBP3585799.1 Crp/Fnr family transcriptional regulator [Peptococcaceae bacterium]